MKNVTKLAAGIALVTSALACTAALAEVSYNAGFASEYYFRGILQKDSSASAGIDFSQGGAYAGAWTADVGDGLEVDGYFGYGIETQAGFSASLGFTGYYYTGEFDDTYQEINLNLGYQLLSFEYSTGTYDNFGAGDQDYDFYALTLEKNGFYGKYGTFGNDFDGDYIELGWGTTISDIDFGVAAIFNSEELSDQTDSSGSPDSGQALVFTIGKSW